MGNHTLWMAVSAIIGGGCFVIIHFTKLLKNPLYVALLQWPANAFVFISWGSAFLDSQGFAKLFAFCGTVVPIIMATSTICLVWRTRRRT